MTVEICYGDLFAQRDADALGHGVNCCGLMGAGIARAFRARWPQMFAAYQQRCRGGPNRLTPGTMMEYWLPDGRLIYNLATQDRPGPFARYDWLERSVGAMMLHAERHHLRKVAIPKIGSGIGGLQWPLVAEKLHAVADPSPVTLVVVI